MLDVEIIRSKLYEYGIEIYSEYPMQENEYCIQTEEMMIFINPNKSSLCISFSASMKPEQASNMTLILKEIHEVNDIDVMDSYAFDMNNNYLVGEEAHEYVKKGMVSGMIEEYARQETYREILVRAKGFNC